MARVLPLACRVSAAGAPLRAVARACRISRAARACRRPSVSTRHPPPLKPGNVRAWAMKLRAQASRFSRRALSSIHFHRISSQRRVSAVWAATRALRVSHRRARVTATVASCICSMISTACASHCRRRAGLAVAAARGIGSAPAMVAARRVSSGKLSPSAMLAVGFVLCLLPTDCNSESSIIKGVT